MFLTSPRGVVTAGMLRVNNDVAIRRPLSADVFIVFARAAQAVGKDDDWKRAVAFGGVVLEEVETAVVYAERVGGNGLPAVMEIAVEYGQSLVFGGEVFKEFEAGFFGRFDPLIVLPVIDLVAGGAV